MLRRIASLSLTLILVVRVFPLMCFVQPVRASGTIYIRADGSIDPPTALISTVDNFTYTWTGSIYDSIVVERDHIVLDGAGYTVQGTGASGSKGIGLSGRSNVIVKNMMIRYFWGGIILEYSSNNTISENKVTNNSYGIYLSESNNNSLSRNNITANNEIGVILESSSNNVLRNNNMFDNKDNFGGVYGHNLSQFVNDVDVSNTVDGKPIYYWVNEVDRAVPTDAGCVVLINSTRITVQNLNLTRNSQGIRLAFTTNSTIAENNITNNRNGIRLDYSSNNSISGNNITNHVNGIYLVDHSDDNTISGNNITTNTRNGIMIYGYSNNNSVNGNDVANSLEGIYIDGSDNDISGNSITNNWYGIRLYYSSDNNSISENHIANNQFGFGLEGSSGSMFYHNNFINNINQVYSSDSVNVWDDGYPSGGNYWSDYGGTDANYDGIGDSNCTIDADNSDRYPLMGTFGEFNATPKQHVRTICNSKISDFDFSGTAISFNVSGENGTAGFCRICVPTALMNVTYKVFVNGTEVSYNLLPCSNETYSYLYFNYTHSTQEVIIVPEFPTFLVLPLFMMATLIATIAYRRKYSNKWGRTRFPVLSKILSKVL